MTVAELVAELMKMPQDANVTVESMGYPTLVSAVSFEEEEGTVFLS